MISFLAEHDLGTALSLVLHLIYESCLVVVVNCFSGVVHQMELEICGKYLCEDSRLVLMFAKDFKHTPLLHPPAISIGQKVTKNTTSQKKIFQPMK